MAGISKNTLAVLVIITIVISVIGTLAVLNTLYPYGIVREGGEPNLISGEVKLDVVHPPQPPGEPMGAEAEVFLDVVPSNEGG